MPRAKKAKAAHKRRKNLLKDAKGLKYGRKNKYRMAKEGLYHAWRDSFDGRRKKKGEFRRLWQIQISAATRLEGLPYNKFISGLKKQNILLDRKILSDLAQNNEGVFKKLVELSRQ